MESGSSIVRQAVILRGLVQGVGFRPRILNLARRVGVSGFVRNSSGILLLEVEGHQPVVREFLEDLLASPPPNAEVHSVDVCEIPPRHEQLFEIAGSDLSSGGPVGILPDLAPCAECLRETGDPGSRRFGYAFTNCTECGPRFTIIRVAPYDRERTTMSPFAMCSECASEYSNPDDRRFHAQAIACPACGPKLELLDGRAKRIATDEPLERAIEWVRAGGIGALKGIGGYHLFCDARNETAVSLLRARKARDEKPFAIMLRDVEALKRFAALRNAEEQHLRSAARPIVLLQAREAAGLAASLAPGVGSVGAMLPCSPLHYVLMERAGTMPLVMTSGNRAHQPTVFRDAEATGALRGIADFFLTHNRGIQFRCDDSVLRIAGGKPVFFRRSRGYAPAPLRLRKCCRDNLLALGGQMKSTFALSGRGQVVVSQHLGDLDDFEEYQEYKRTIAEYERLFDIQPKVLVHDLHPDYLSSRYARERAARDGLRTVTVQHHHAHMASCMAEHGLQEPVIGVIFDGTGYGTDGSIWGGEFLVGDAGQVQRVAHLRNVAMPAGERAIREPWRMAVAYLLDSGFSPEAHLKGIDAFSLGLVEKMIRKGINSPLTSSCGRFLDAAACLLGMRNRASYDGQPAIELEALAVKSTGSESYTFRITGDPAAIDLRPVIGGIVSDLAAGVPKPKIARKVHYTLSEVILCICTDLRNATGMNKVALSGGVFMNVLLLSAARASLESAGFAVFAQEQVPPNDGGLCLGQLAVASAQTQTH